MNLLNLTRDNVREILRASEGIPSSVGPRNMAHPLTNHLRSAGYTRNLNVDGSPSNKTRFISMADMEEAVWQILQSPVGLAAVKGLKPGYRPNAIKWDLDRLLAFNCDVPDPQGRPNMRHSVTFTTHEQLRAGFGRTKCLLVIEGRERAGVTHIQVVTAYPSVEKDERQALLRSVRLNDEFRRR